MGAYDQPIKLPLQNGLKLSYGEILAMPDYYGDLHHQISTEKTDEKRQARFGQIFSDFSKSDVTYFNAFWPIIQNERDSVMKAVKMHQSVSEIYQKISDQENIALATATHFRYLTLSLTDFDHFNQDAIVSYQAGHAVAINTALLGFSIQSGTNLAANSLCEKQSDYAACIAQKSKNALITAYEQNAFASHFLSDRFAAGHMRNPYRELYEYRPIAILGALSGSLMHGEDNRLGLIVTNSDGNYWMAYGDRYYFSLKNKTNRELLQKVLQQSANEITTAYQSGVDIDPQSINIIGLIPTPIDPGKTVLIAGVGQVEQTSPLYRDMFGSVWQRIDVNNPDDDQWTPIWSTVITLLTYHSPDQNNISMKWQLILKQHHMENTLAKVGIYD